MISAENDWTVFCTRPVSLVLILLSVVTVVVPLYRGWRDPAP
jgi:TctA family transporter